MSGFADLLGLNAPTLGDNPTAYTIGDTWGDTIGPFTDRNGDPIDLSVNVSWTCQILDRPGGTVLASPTVAGHADGTLTWGLDRATTLTLGSGARQDCCWHLTGVYADPVDHTVPVVGITFWGSADSEFIILAP
jgi:hypothetical protein